MRRRFWPAIAMALVMFPACGKDQSAAAPPAMPPTPVALATASLAPIADATEYVGTLKSLQSTTVQPQVDGRITQIFVKSGDRVRVGAPIAQIDPQRQQAAVTSQEAERNSRAAAVAFARQQAERARSLLAAGAISKQEAEQAETALRTAEADLQALSAQVQQQQVQLRYFTVTAPTSGIVGDVPVRVGNQVTPQTLLTTIDQNDTLEANVSVPIERAPQLRVGLPMDIRTSDGAETVAVTKIAFISPRVDDATQSVLVKSTVTNRGGALRASGHRRAARQRSVLRVRRRRRRRQARREAARDQSRPDCRRQLSRPRRPQGRRPHRRLRRAEARRRRALTGSLKSEVSRLKCS
jgi:RND family efflux transporter MFP subunit